MTHFIAQNNKIDVPVECQYNSTINVAKLSSFDVGDDFSDSRTNLEGMMIRTTVYILLSMLLS